MAVSQEEIDQKNKSFWNELCGTQLAKELGVVDASPESLAKFDDFYLDYYPYLAKYLHLDQIKGKNVLEVGLGYGTVSQLLASAGANYHGLDIAANAVAMAQHRLEQNKKSGDVRVGSMIECPFEDNYFDYVVSIGCFHHTGDLQACIDQTHRILKPGGKAIIMVYNKFSLRQWAWWPLRTAKNLMAQYVTKNATSVSESQRKAYDASSTQEAAPMTEFFSVQEIENIFNAYNTVKVTRENFDEGFKFRVGRVSIYNFKSRKTYLDSSLARKLGLDLYIEAVK
jgi:ubiquinone/menaquinone biosynthesis C-methylase UbiE